MPYIKPHRRPALDKHLGPLRNAIECPGELAYALYSLCVGQVGELDGYEKRRSVVGDLECTKAEFVRKHLAPYEDRKLVENGDVT